MLNAEQNEGEAEVVAQAGQPGAVTVATNMAGRGTDIKLGPGVAEAGGLHVIGTERHEAERIDRQLIGRAGRQGDPGTAGFMLSLEDQLLEGLGTKRQNELAEIGRRGGNRNWNAYAPLFRIAQAPRREAALQAAPRPDELRQAPPGDAQGHRGRPVRGLTLRLEVTTDEITFMPNANAEIPPPPPRYR